MRTLAYQDHDDRPREDHIVVVRGVTWADYQRQLELRGERSAPRLAYTTGALEIMSPSQDHEKLKSVIGRLIEAYCFHVGIDFSPFGAWTLEDKALDRGAEPDECYVFGDKPDATRPDPVVEVIWTSGRLNTLEIYAKLGVREAWFWRRGQITIHALRGGEYEQVERSEALPDLDLALLTRHLSIQPVSRTVKAFRANLI